MPDGSCTYVDPTCCISDGGIPQGPGSVCGGTQACCLPDGRCLDMDSICCVNEYNGVPQGDGSACTQTIACCLPGGGCADVDPLCCDDMGGTPSPFGAPACLGDGNSNGIDDACEEPTGWEPGDPYKMHYPQLPDSLGWDVWCTNPIMLADDFLCSESGWIQDVHFWGSWMHDIVGDMGMFWIRIFSDIPADPPQVPYSRPGDILHWVEVMASDVVIVEEEPSPQGWYDPSQGFFLFDDHIRYFQYNIYLDSADWFWQEAGTVYWLNIVAFVAGPPEAVWGWKSSVDHWNDDAVWAFEDPPYMWIDLWEPPDFFISMDMSFVITGERPGCCMPPIRGNVDYDPGDVIDISDLVYLTDYMFTGGPAPVCVEEANMDASCCASPPGESLSDIDIADLVYLVDYMFNMGPLPQPCP